MRGWSVTFVALLTLHTVILAGCPSSTAPTGDSTPTPVDHGSPGVDASPNQPNSPSTPGASSPNTADPNTADANDAPAQADPNEPREFEDLGRIDFDDPPGTGTADDPVEIAHAPLAGKWTANVVGTLRQSVAGAAVDQDPREQSFRIEIDETGKLRGVSVVQRLNGRWTPGNVYASEVGDVWVVRAADAEITERQSFTITRLEIDEDSFDLTMTVDYSATLASGSIVGNGLQTVHADLQGDQLECEAQLALNLETICPECRAGEPCPPGCEGADPPRVDETITLTGALTRP